MIETPPPKWPFVVSGVLMLLWVLWIGSQWIVSQVPR